jgi:putative transposase
LDRIAFHLTSSDGCRDQKSHEYSGDKQEDRFIEQAAISMSRKGNPYDNAACESFMKTLKQEEVYRNEYRDFHEARSRIEEFLDRVYNQKRLQSALGYLSPAQFEQNGGER